MNQLSASAPKLAEQIKGLDWDELTVALNECIFHPNQSVLPKEYGPASYLPLEAENEEQKEHGGFIKELAKASQFFMQSILTVSPLRKILIRVK